jgi:pyruvate dehydrogenase E1 component alpha subunit
MDGEIDNETLLKMYRLMILDREYELAVNELVEEGKAPAFHLGYGQEAIGVGAVLATEPGDWLMYAHRGYAHIIAKGVSLKKMLAEHLWKKTGLNKGRCGQMHLADMEHNIPGQSASVGAGDVVATGIALALKMKGTDRVVLKFLGDGAAARGTFHEGANLAGVWKLPLIYIIENNYYAVSTHISESMSCRNFADRGVAYGMPGISVDGNDVIAVYTAVKEAVKRAREGKGPTLIEAKTYRIMGHYGVEPGGGTGGEPYRKETKEEFEEWKEKKDPVKRLRDKLFAMQILTEELDEKIKAEIKAEIDEAIKYALEAPYPEVDVLYEELYL